MSNYTKSLYRAIAQWLNMNGAFKDYKEIKQIVWSGNSMSIFYLSTDDAWCKAYIYCSREQMMKNLLGE